MSLVTEEEVASAVVSGGGSGGGGVDKGEKWAYTERNWQPSRVGETEALR